MTRFTRCESSLSFPVIVVRSALLCHRTAPEKVPERTDKRPWKGRGTGTRRVSSRQRHPLPLPPSSSPPSHHAPPPPSWPLWSKANTHCQPCRDSSGRAFEYECAGSGTAWRRRERRLRAWAEHERLTVAMALAETLHHSAQKVTPIAHDSSRQENHNPQIPFSIRCFNHPQPPPPPSNLRHSTTPPPHPHSLSCHAVTWSPSHSYLSRLPLTSSSSSCP